MYKFVEKNLYFAIFNISTINYLREVSLSIDLDDPRLDKPPTRLIV